MAQSSSFLCLHLIVVFPLSSSDISATSIMCQLPAASPKVTQCFLIQLSCLCVPNKPCNGVRWGSWGGVQFSYSSQIKLGQLCWTVWYSVTSLGSHTHTLLIDSLSFLTMNIYCSSLIYEVKRIYPTVEHNAITNAITSPPVWPVCVEMKHMPQEKGQFSTCTSLNRSAVNNQLQPFISYSR